MKDQDQLRQETPKPPTPLARKLVRYMLGFGVGIGVGLAPYLGLFKVPFFAPLLDIIPDPIRNMVIPLSAALMGMVAVVVQWYGGEYLTRKRLRTVFGRTLLIAVLTFVVLIIIHTAVVVTVPILGGEDSVSFIVGFTRPLKPPCTSEVSDAECIERVTFDTKAIESFWGDRQIRLARLALMLSYLLFTSSFGALIGLIILREALVERRHV
jgi:hypothetical protein